MKLFEHQEELKRDVYNEWSAGAMNVLAVLPTGGGKSALLSNIMAEYPQPSIAIAHRGELVSQLALALARNDVPHRIIGTRDVIQESIRRQIDEVGKSLYQPNAHCAVASVGTLINKPNERWMNNIGLWVVDEFHHCLKENQWGKAIEMFPGARGLGVTATPSRADGKGLGRHADGVMDAMVFGRSMRWLIDNGYLSDYRLFTPPNDIDLDDVNVTASGDYSYEPLRKAVGKSHITGDIVEQYLKIAPGKLGLTFTVDIETAERQAEAFRARGVPAVALSGKTNPAYRAVSIRKFARGDYLQLVTCDLISEGFDVPACEVVSLGRPSQSFTLHQQQVGRGLRRMEGKTHLIIIDHVGNIMQRHGLPDKHREFTLNRREKRSKGAAAAIEIMLRTCPSCTATYERVLGPTCPYCKETVQPAGRSAPEQVDGDLTELSPEALARLRGEVNKQYQYPHGATAAIKGRIDKLNRERAIAQEELRQTIALWAGKRSAATDSETIAKLQREFYLNYGVDVMSAQTGNAGDIKKLIERIDA